MSEDLSEEKSYFDGGLAQWIGWKLLGGLITLVTLGICYPCAVCMIYKWKINHTVVKGRRLKFVGKAGSLFGLWIKWILLSIITIGIYALWIPISLEKWRVKHTVFADEEDAASDNITSEKEDKIDLSDKTQKRNYIITLVGSIVALVFTVIPAFNYINGGMGIEWIKYNFRNSNIPDMISSIMIVLSNVCCLVALVGLIINLIACIQKKNINSKLILPLIGTIGYIVFRIVRPIISVITYGDSIGGSIFYTIHFMLRSPIWILAAIIVTKVFANKSSTSK